MDNYEQKAAELDVEILKLQKELVSNSKLDEQKAAELDVEISRVQKELISNSRNRIATELLILRLIDDVETCTLYRVRSGRLSTTLKELN